MAVVSKAIHQAAAMALATAQLQFGEAVNVRVVEQGFSLRSMDDDITNLIKSFEPAANAILPKVDVGLILQANLDP